MARDPYKYFRIEARDLTEQLGQSVLELERAGNGAEVVPRLLRLAHTLKGAARVVRLPEIADHAHSIEGLLTPFRDSSRAVPPDSINVLLKLLDGIGTRLEALSPAEAEGASSAPAARQAQLGDLAGPLATDAAEVDNLITAVTGAATEARMLDQLASDAASARRLASQIAEQLTSLEGGLDTAGPTLDTLRALLTRLERGIATSHSRVERDLRQVHETAEQLRLVSAATLFPSLARIARDSAQLLNKDVAFETSGGEVRLDAQIVRLVQDALLQLVRNAVAHGIEVPRDRTAAGKTPAGRVTVSVSRLGRVIVFRCADDGRGVDVAALKAAAMRKGRVVPDSAQATLADLLLQGGVSTALSVSEVAGRGIGMDIVREAVARLNARFAVRSEPGKGTTFELTVPLSLTAVESLVVEAAGSRALVPLAAIRRAVRLRPSDVHRTSAGEAVVDDGEAIPIVHLPEVLGRNVPVRRAASFTAVIVQGEGGRAALGISRIAGTAGVIVRALPELAPATDVIAGAAFDTDGSALLMLDADGLVAAAGRHRNVAAESVAARRPLLVIDDSLTTRMLEQSILVSAGYEVDVAVSAEEGLARVARRDYALILVDVEMPGMDGFGFVESLRRDPATRHIPAILVTSRNAPEDKRRGMEAGAQDYVVKSEFDQAALLGRIRELVT